MYYKKGPSIIIQNKDFEKKNEFTSTEQANDSVKRQTIKTGLVQYGLSFRKIIVSGPSSNASSEPAEPDRDHP
ncbi:hypothetical protein Hanom_Chr12g01135341 [Helianthus anomalus]